MIFRKLWRIPLAGMAALHKKRISNEVLIGYSGEAYFYAWARQRTQMVAYPFGAVKDVTILSAVAGNTFTLLLILLMIPFAKALPPSITPNNLLESAGLMVLMSVPFFIVPKRVFSLSRRALWWVFGVHMIRLVLGTFFVALAWHFALPGVALGTWLFLGAVRMLASRLPLVPNKELLFASTAMVVLGSDAEAVKQLVALVATLTLLTHIVLIGGFSLTALMRQRSISYFLRFNSYQYSVFTITLGSLLVRAGAVVEKAVDVFVRPPHASERLIGLGGGINTAFTLEQGRESVAALIEEDSNLGWVESQVVNEDELANKFNVLEDTVKQWRASGEIIGIAGGLLYPVRQFFKGRPIAGLDLVLAHFDSPDLAWEWLITPNTYTLGLPPLSRLRVGAVSEVQLALNGALDFA